MKILLLVILAFVFYISPVYAADTNPIPLPPGHNINPPPPPTPTPTPTPCVGTKGFGPCPAGLSEIEDTVGNVISVIVGLGFIAMLVMLVFAGIKYLTSGGEPKALQAAHSTLSWAILGIFFLAIAWLILQLVAAFTGIDITIFNIKILCKEGADLLKFCK